MRKCRQPLPEAPAFDLMVIGECRVVEREQQQIRDDDDPEDRPARLGHEPIVIDARHRGRVRDRGIEGIAEEDERGGRGVITGDGPRRRGAPGFDPGSDSRPLFLA